MTIRFELLFLLLAGPTIAAAQWGMNGCEVKSPPATVLGLKLRMTTEQVRAVIKRSPEREMSAADLKGVPGLARVKGFIFEFYEGRLSRLDVSFRSPHPDWGDPKRFARAFSARTGLPYRSWVFNPTSAVIVCDEFMVEAYAETNHLSMTDLIALDAEKKKLFDEAERKRKESKP